MLMEEPPELNGEECYGVNKLHCKYNSKSYHKYNARLVLYIMSLLDYQPEQQGTPILFLSSANVTQFPHL